MVRDERSAEAALDDCGIRSGLFWTLSFEGCAVQVDFSYRIFQMCLLAFFLSIRRLEHFGLSWRKLGLSKAVNELLRAVVGDSWIFSRPDNAAFDMTVHSAHRWNQASCSGKF